MKYCGFCSQNELQNRGTSGGIVLYRAHHWNISTLMDRDSAAVQNSDSRMSCNCKGYCMNWLGWTNNKITWNSPVPDWRIACRPLRACCRTCTAWSRLDYEPIKGASLLCCPEADCYFLQWWAPFSDKQPKIRSSLICSLGLSITRILIITTHELERGLWVLLQRSAKINDKLTKLKTKCTIW